MGAIRTCGGENPVPRQELEYEAAPRKLERGQVLVLYRSVFSIGYAVCGKINISKEGH
jgi:hypothetical protein